MIFFMPFFSHLINDCKGLFENETDYNIVELTRMDPGGY